MHYLWRAVDQNGMVLDILVKHRDTDAAKRFFGSSSVAGSKRSEFWWRTN